MGTIQKLHNWCMKHGYDYRYSTEKQMFEISKPSFSFALSLSQLERAGKDLNALLYTVSSNPR